MCISDFYKSLATIYLRDFKLDPKEQNHTKYIYLNNTMVQILSIIPQSKEYYTLTKQHFFMPWTHHCYKTSFL